MTSLHGWRRWPDDPIAQPGGGRQFAPSGMLPALDTGKPGPQTKPGRKRAKVPTRSSDDNRLDLVAGLKPAQCSCAWLPSDDGAMP
jgi:hypothetical protein